MRSFLCSNSRRLPALHWCGLCHCKVTHCVLRLCAHTLVVICSGFDLHNWRKSILRLVETELANWHIAGIPAPTCLCSYLDRSNSAMPTNRTADNPLASYLGFHPVTSTLYTLFRDIDKNSRAHIVQLSPLARDNPPQTSNYRPTQTYIAR